MRVDLTKGILQNLAYVQARSSERNPQKVAGSYSKSFRDEET
jgi:hypothetical protein